MKEQFETAYPAETLYLWTVKKSAKRLLGIAANRYPQFRMTKYFIIFILIFSSCENRKTAPNFIKPRNEEVEKIIEAIVYSDSLSLSSQIIKVEIDKVIKSKQKNWIPIYTPMSVDLRKLQVALPDKWVKVQPLDMNTVLIPRLFKIDGIGKEFIDQSDSSYLLFQNEAITEFRINDELARKLNTTTSIEQKNKRNQGKSYRFYDLTIPIFSSDMNKAYVELTLYGSGAQALYLEKINSKWTIIRRIGLWIS